MNKLQDLI